MPELYRQLSQNQAAEGKERRKILVITHTRFLILVCVTMNVFSTTRQKRIHALSLTLAVCLAFTNRSEIHTEML